MVKVLLNSVNIPSKCSSVAEIYDDVARITGLDSEEFYLVQNGTILNKDSQVNHNNDVHAILRLVGGKGGFGSMLRAIGAQIEKTTNKEACRDLSGRRLRDINEEKRIKAWLDKQKEQQEDPEEKFQKKIGKLLAKPKHEFKDEQFEADRADLTEKIDESVEIGMKKAMEKSKEAEAAVKRKAEDDEKSKKKKKKAKKGALWLGADDMSSSSETDSDSEEGQSSSKSSS